MNYQFLQFLPNTDVTLLDVSGRIVGPTVDTLGKTFLVNFQPELERSFMGLIERAFWFPHNSKVFITQTDSVMLHILYGFWIKFCANHFLLHFHCLYVMTYSPLLRVWIFILGIFYTQTETTDAQWQPGQNHEQLIKYRPKPQVVFSEHIDPQSRGAAKSCHLRKGTFHQPGHYYIHNFG